MEKASLLCEAFFLSSVIVVGFGDDGVLMMGYSGLWVLRSDF